MTISVEMVEVVTTSVTDSSNHFYHSVRTSLSIIAKLFDQLAFLSTHTHTLSISLSRLQVRQCNVQRRCWNSTSSCSPKPLLLRSIHGSFHYPRATLLWSNCSQ